MMKEIGVPLFNMDKVATKHFGVETEPGYGIHIHGTVATLFTTTGAIAVNKECERVVNESGDELDIALASMNQSSDGRLYIVMDQASYDVFSQSLINSQTFTQEQLDQFIAENGTGVTKLVKGDTLADAAAAMGLDGDKLTQTVEAYNSGIAAGEPDPFKRGYTAELKDGPYYIMQTVARFATSLGGVNVSNDFEVLDVNEQPVPGLYAAGEVVGNINGSYAEYLIWCFSSGMEFGNVIAGK
jgi:succinate dehydrogenase/fumarate reductase flavoprotein subunit